MGEGAPHSHDAFMSKRHIALTVSFTLVALGAVGALSASGCANNVDDGADGFEPDDLKDNVELQGLVDCSERGDTGYRQGNSFSITVVTVDGRPVETATANAYIAMQHAAANDGVSLRIVSGFRTMAEQQHLYSCYINGNCNNGNLAARPGYSNHQSGHALDLNTSDGGVASWLRDHAAHFGFSRTVPSESWHFEWWGNASDFNGPCGGGGGNTNQNQNPAPAASCDALPAGGGVVDDGDNCFEAGGPSAYLRAVSQGNDGDAIWTGATANASAANFAIWNLKLAEAGSYQLEAYVPDLATSKQTKYSVVHKGQTSSVVVDQSGANGWVTLGTFDFAAGGSQRVRVNDNTGEAASQARKVVFDAVRLTRIDGGQSPVQANPCAYVKVNTSGGTLNVRANPNTQQAAVGSVDDGVVVRSTDTVQGQNVSGHSEWHRIQTASLQGYVSGAFTVCQDGP